MSHELFLNIFNGPRNIFLSCIFVILIFKLEVGAQNIQTSLQEDSRKTNHIKTNDIDSADIRQIVVKTKNQKMFDAVWPWC